MSQELEKRLERIENRLSAHTSHLIRAFQKLERLAIEADLSDIATEAGQEIAALRSLLGSKKDH